MKYSIIVPIYGVEKYIRTCVDSLIAQKYQDLEIILVDDGSKDNCPMICDEYKEIDERIVVLHKENGGLVSARQAGAKIARGEYVLCVDGDDWVCDDCINVVDSVIEKYHPDVVCFCVNRVDHTGAYVSSTTSPEYGYFERSQIRKKIFPYLIEDKFGNYFMPSICSKVIRRDLYVPYQLELNPLVKIGEDNACTKPILSKANSLVIIENKLYNYRLNDDSMTKTRKQFSFDDPALIGQHFEKTIDLKDNDFQEQIYRCVTHLLFNTCVSAFYEKDNYKNINEWRKTQSSK